MKIKAWSPAQLGKAPLVGFLYVRVSLGRTMMVSPETQKNNGFLTAKLRSVHIPEGHVIEDLDESGQDFGHRKVMWMIEQIRQGAANCIIVLETSRWGRNLLESRTYVKELYEAGGVLISVTQPIDPTTADGLMIMNHFMNMDEHQGNKIGEAWVRAHKNRVYDRQRPHHGREIFAYMRCPDCRRSEKNQRAYEFCHTCKGILIPNPEVAPHFAEAYLRRIGGDPMRAIVVDLNAIGIRTINGKPISVSGLRVAMDNGFAAGLLRVNSTSTESRTAGPWDWEAWPKGAQKALITLDTWKKYVRTREAQRAPEHRLRYPSHALSTFFRCGVENSGGMKCMTGMHLNPSTTKVDNFRCGNESSGMGCGGVTISTNRAEKLVLAWIEERAQGQERAQIELQRSAQANSDLKVMKNLETQEREIKRKIDLLVESLLDGTFTKEQVRKRKDELGAELRVVQSKLSVVQESVTSNSAPPPEAFVGFLQLWPRLTVLEKQKSLRVIIDHIIVHKTPGQQMNTIEVVPKWAPLADRLVAHGRNWDRLRARDAA